MKLLKKKINYSELSKNNPSKTSFGAHFVEHHPLVGDCPFPLSFNNFNIIVIKMEFDSLFTAVQGIMRSHQNTTIVPFEKVNKDNDIVSANVVERLDSLFTELGLKDEHKRKINLLFLVNTNFPSIQTLEDDENFWHLLGVLPKMSPYMYFYVATHLNFHMYIGEVIYSCPEYLSIELLEVISDHMKFLNPDFAVQFFHKIYKSIFWKVITLQEESKSSIVIKKFVTILKETTSFDLNVLLDSLDWGKERKLIYFGYGTEMFLTILKFCISKMKNKIKYENIDIYEFTVDFDYSKWGECKTEINWTNYCLGLIVAKCAEMVMAISVDMYMSWCEEDVNGSVDRTLQTAVREAAYYCREEIRSILHMADQINGLRPLEASLNNIALQPKTEDDEIEKADAETIVMNLLNPKRNQAKWLKGLIRIPGIFESSTYMRVIQDSAHLFDDDVTKVMLDTLLDFLSTSQCPRDFHEAAKDLFFSCLKKQPLSIQMDILSYYFDKKCTSTMLQKENFEEFLTITLNKLSAANENKEEVLSDVVMLCFENREEVVRSLLGECVGSALKTDHLLELLSQIPPLASVPCNNTHLGLVFNMTVHLMDSVRTSLDKKKDNFTQLVRKLCVLGILEGNIFFPENVLPRFEESIKKNDTQNIIFYLDVMNVYVTQPTLSQSDAAVYLLFFARFLDDIRPRITNFSLDKMSATSKAIDIVQELSKKVVNFTKQRDDQVKWAQEMSLELKGSTRLHMELLWTTWGGEAPSIPNWATCGLGLGKDLLNASTEKHRKLTTSTVKILPTLALKEWYRLGSLDTVSPQLVIPTVEAVVDAVLVALQVPFLFMNLQIINNMLINFSQFLWEKVIPKLKKCNEEESVKLRGMISHLQDVLPEEIQKTRAPQIQLILQSITRPTK